MPVHNQSKSLRFSLISVDLRAFLVGRSDDRRSFTLEMMQSRPGFWFVEAELAAGTYRTRFYCGNDQQMTYFGPAPCDGSWQDGLDAVVVVNEAEPIKPAPGATSRQLIRAEFMRYGRRQLSIAGDSLRFLASMEEELSDHLGVLGQAENGGALPVQDRDQRQCEQANA